MSRTADVVIVGGGVVGASAAYHLAIAGAGRVLLLEREDRLATGSTGACAGGFRTQFSSEVNIRLSLASVPMITGFTREHGLPLDVAQDGYLFLVRDEAMWRDFVAANELQRSLGVEADLLVARGGGGAGAGDRPRGDRRRRLRPERRHRRSVGAHGGVRDARPASRGRDPSRRVRDVDPGRIGPRRRASRRAGRGGSTRPVVVNAAGPWAGELARTAGVEIPLEPVPRHVLVTGAFPGRPERRTLVIDAATSFYFHREGAGVLMGMGSPRERPSFDTRPDERFVAEELLPTAVRVFPPLEDAAVEHSWVGLYEMTPDRHPIIGEAPGLPGLYLANGFSGHGFQHAPVVGKLLAELIVGGEATTVDVSSLGLERFASGRLAAEGHVV